MDEINNFEYYAIVEKLKLLDSEQLLSKKKRVIRDNVHEYQVLNPDKEKSIEMIKRFVTCVCDNNYNASFVDVVRLIIAGGDEHFIRVRLGNILYYLSEYGLSVITDMMNKHETLNTLKYRAQLYNIYKTEFEKQILQSKLYEYYESRFADENDLIDYIRSFTHIQLLEECDKHNL